MQPSEIRFIQDSIKSHFQDGERVNDVAEDLCKGLILARKFPTIKVIFKDGKYYSFDNRRLYVFRVAEYRGVLTKIPVVIVSKDLLDPGRFTTLNDGREVEVRGDNTLQHCKRDWLRPAPFRPQNFNYQFAPTRKSFRQELSYTSSASGEAFLAPPKHGNLNQEVILPERDCDESDNSSSWWSWCTIM